MKKNNWYVITGAPSSGKTTILKYLEKKGYKVFYEWARIYIDQEMKKGKTLKEIRKDEMNFQEKVLDLKINFENNLNPEDLVFMERGIPDTSAYLKLIKAKISPSWKSSIKKSRYKKVFLLKLVEFKKDYARTENEKEAKLLDNLLEKSYTDLGIPVERVPYLPIAKRAKYILDNL
jgi:predicted ATPase